MSKIELRFTPAKETKGTLQFQESVADGVEPSVGTLYVRKSALDTLGWNTTSGAAALRVTIELPD